MGRGKSVVLVIVAEAVETAPGSKTFSKMAGETVREDWEADTGEVKNEK